MRATRISDLLGVDITVGESAGSISICYKILSGRAATRSISMQFRTVQGEAEGIAYNNFEMVTYVQEVC